MKPLCALAIMLATLLCACGDEQPLTPRPSSHFDGVWAGTATVSIGGDADRSYDASITGATTSDTMVRLTGICPDATATADGIGLDAFSWQGVIECRPTFLGGCLIEFEYRSGVATVADGVMSMEFTGFVNGVNSPQGLCSERRPLRLVFSGRNVDAG